MIEPNPPPSRTAGLLEHGGVVLHGAAGEDDDPAAVERALHDVPHPIGQGRPRNPARRELGRPGLEGPERGPASLCPPASRQA